MGLRGRETVEVSNYLLINLRDKTAEVGAFTLELIRVRELFREPGRFRDGSTSSLGNRR